MNTTKFKLIVMNFLELAVWGAYLTSQGRYLAEMNFGSQIGWFFSVQGLVSIFMPALVGIIADRWIPAQKMLSLCHFLAAAGMLAAGIYGLQAGEAVRFPVLFALYTFSVAFYMPTISLVNSVAYTMLERDGQDTVKAYPPIRIWGTIGFIVLMWVVDLCGFQASSMQYVISGGLSIMLAVYALTLPACPVSGSKGESSLLESLGLKAFTLFKDPKMAIFFIFSFLLGAALQVSNGFANTYMGDFGAVAEYAHTFGVKHSNMLISLSQISETFCILLIPFFLKKLGIKRVMLTAMLAWGLRFAFFGLGNPGGGVWLFVLSMVVYGVAFDFFNISGSLFVDKNTDTGIRSSAQGLFMLMTNGFGASIGSLAAQAVVNASTGGLEGMAKMEGWSTAWYIFAAYAFTIAILFAILFRYKHNEEATA
ncbi:MAG: MFS transporter [Bacteroidales bacterium]|nr:MFS transporter [Bacteroidales bacterium]